MKKKQDRIKDGITRIKKLKDEVILRYTDEIDFDYELSLYNVMMEHFCKGELDDVFLTDASEGMSEDQRKELFTLVREYQGLCFYKSDSEYWLESLENTPVVDYDLVAYSILDSFDFLLNLAKDGGRDVLEQLNRLQQLNVLSDYASIGYLRNTFIDDNVLTQILLRMANSEGYDLFTDLQKGELLNYPEGTLYSYGKDEIRITSPFVLAIELYNRMNDGEDIEDLSDIEAVSLGLKEFFRKEDFGFSENVLVLSDQYRDYIRKNNFILDNETFKIVDDLTGEKIKLAWQDGDSFLGSMIDTPYSSGSK